MQQTTKSPIAKRVIQKCGGVRVVMGITGRTRLTVYRWCMAKEKGGTGGIIPAEMAQMLMAAAARGEVPLTPADFFDIPEAVLPAAR